LFDETAAAPNGMFSVSAYRVIYATSLDDITPCATRIPPIERSLTGNPPLGSEAASFLIAFSIAPLMAALL
jgi:hypothetical protein